MSARTGEASAELVVALGFDRNDFGFCLGVDHVQAFQAHPAPLVEVGFDPLGLDQEFVRRTNHTRGFSGGLVARQGLVMVFLQPRPARVRIIDEHQGIRRQVVQNGLLLLVEKGRKRLDARGRVSAQQAVKEFRAFAGRGSDFLGELAQGVSLLDHPLAGKDQLACRRGGGEGDLAQRTLAPGVELANGVDFVTKKFHPDGIGAVGRVEIHDAAAHGNFTGLRHQGHTEIAVVDEGLKPGVAVHALAQSNGSLPGAYGVPSGYAQGEGCPIADHYGGGVFRGMIAEGKPAVEHVHPLGHQESLGREAVVGQRVGPRKDAESGRARALAEHGAQILGQRVTAFGRGAQDEHRLARVGTDQFGGGHGPRGSAEASQANGSVASLYLLGEGAEGRAWLFTAGGHLF